MKHSKMYAIFEVFSDMLRLPPCTFEEKNAQMLNFH